MAVIPIQDGKDGLAEASFGATAAGGDTVDAGVGAGGWALPVVLLVANGHATDARTVTAGGLSIEVPAEEVGVLPLRGGSIASAVLEVTYSDDSADVTVAAVRLW